MAESLGTIRGQMILDVKQALASYTSARQAHVATVTALHTGAGALTAVGASIAGVGVAMAAGLLSAVNASAQFERKLDYFMAVSGTAANQYDLVSQKALQLGADTIFSANQIADSFVELGKAGVSAKDIIAGVGDGVAALGAAANIPLDTAANIITAAVQTFALGADQAVKVADQLAGAANASIVDVQDLGTSLKYAGGVAATLGIPFSDLNTALAILGTRGIKGSTAGTSLRQTLTSLTGSTKAARNELESLGIITAEGSNRFFDLNGNVKPLPQVFDILHDSLKNLTAEQQISAVKTIFQQRAISTVMTLANGGSAAFDKMAASIGKTTAAEVAAKRLDNLSGDIEILRGNLDTLMVSTGSGLQTFFRGIVQGVTGMIQAFLSLPQSVQTTIATLTGLGAVFLIVFGAMAVFAGGALNIIALVIQLNVLFPALGIAIRSLVGSIYAMNVALAANPFVRIIAIIGVLVSAFIILYNSNKAFHDAVQPLFVALQGLFVQLGPIIQRVFGVLAQFLTSLAGSAASSGAGFITMLISLATTIGSTLGGAIATILPALMSFIQAFITFLMPAIQAIMPLITALAAVFAAAFGGNFTALPGLITNVFTAFSGLVGVIATQVIPAIIQFVTTIIVTLIGMLPTIIQAAVTMFTGLITALATVLPMVIAAVLQLILGIVTALVGMLPTLIQAAVTLFTGLVNLILTMLPVIIQAGITLFTGLIQALVTIIPLLVNAIVTLLPILITTIVGLIPTLVNAAIQLFLGLITGLLTALPQIITALVNAIPLIITALVDAIPLIISAAIQMFLGILTALITAIPQILTALIGAIPQIVLALVNAIPQIIDGALRLFIGIVTGLLKAIPQIIEALIKMIPQLVDALVKAGPQLADAGVQLIQGLINGIGSMGSALWDAATSIAGKAIDAIKGFFGIHSPSRVFAQIGVFLIQGLINGVSGMTRSAVGSVQAMAAAVAGVPINLAPLQGISDSIGIAQSIAVQSGTVGVETPTAAAVDELNKTLKQIAEKDTINVEKLEVNNPEPEPASESVPRQLRALSYQMD